MAYDRYDEHRGRGRNPDQRTRGSGGDRDHGRHEDRGFFERAGDEVRSWFGDDDDARRQQGQHRGMTGERGRSSRDDRHDQDKPAWGPDLNWGRDRDDDRFGRDDQREASRDQGRERDEDRSHRPMDWTVSNRDYRSGGDRGGYHPLAGDYGRSGSRDQGRDEEDRESGRSQWDRDDYRRTSFAGSATQSNHDDAHYHQWRQQRMGELDRDYDEYRRENNSRFESDFGIWRERRQEKRQHLERIRENMDVVGNDDEHVGKVERVAGDRIILAKSDQDSGGAPHSLSCTAIDRVEDDRVKLDMPADKARDRWRDDNRERALFERDDQGSGGPHMLDRSFSGTYR